MGVPKKRKTKSGTRMRRSHHGLKALHLAKCKKCGAKVRPHEACRECGYYPRSSKGSEAAGKKTDSKKVN